MSRVVEIESLKVATIQKIQCSVLCEAGQDVDVNFLILLCFDVAQAAQKNNIVRRGTSQLVEIIALSGRLQVG